MAHPHTAANRAPPEADRRAPGPQGVGGLGDTGPVRGILDMVEEAIVAFEPATHVVIDANRAAADLFGEARDGVIGRPLSQWMVDVDHQRLDDLIRPLTDGAIGSRTVTLAVRRADDRMVPVEILFQAIDLDGSRSLVAIGRDVGERIQAQARLQRLAEAEHARAAELDAVINAMGEAVIVCAQDGGISLANPAGLALFPGSEARTYRDLLDQVDDPTGLAPTLGTRGGPVEFATRADPNRWVEVSTYPVGGGALAPHDGETIVVMRDTTETRRRERIRETFVGVLSHELRTPVTTIFGGAKLLAREGSTLDEDTRRSVFADIQEEAERLHRLVEDVVALNRFGDPGGDIGMEPVLLQRLLPRVVASEEYRWPAVSFALWIEPDLRTVAGDPTYVEQVIRNLLSNAAKYGGAGSSVTIRAAAAGDEVTVRILDDGPGFSAQETSRLFELFYRSPETARAATGAGIGLFVCARLVAAMGGRIWAQPRPVGGAEFGFALPTFAE